MNDDKLVLLIVLIVASGIGFAGGIAIGHNEACLSLHLEWVKDRCMKVTREGAK